mmetsp:Transcript_65823/g.130471  ORF Transcript_65823/g.130471 Transcript_65823/m.130471 type:complete len:198 (-) Transcript_65823:244-837(-)
MLGIVAALGISAASFGFSVDPQKTQCFDEHAHESDHVQGEWSIIGGTGFPTLKVSVTSPSGDNVYSIEGEKSGSFDYYATVEGSYNVCFTSGAAAGSSAVEVTAKIHIGDPPDLIQLAKTEHLTPIEERIKNLHESLNAVRDLQDQMREQDEAQSKMTRSTRSWLLWFTVIEAVVLLTVTGWQNLYLKSFFEVKRVV